MGDRLEEAGVLLAETHDLLEVRLKHRIARLRPRFLPGLMSRRGHVCLFFDELARHAHGAARSRARSPSPAAPTPSRAAASHLARRSVQGAAELGGCEFLVCDALDGRGHLAMHRHAARRHRHALVPTNQGRRVPQVDDLSDEGLQPRNARLDASLMRDTAAARSAGACRRDSRARSRPASACGFRGCLRR